jgi:glutamine synthetase adenylyltransferase
VRGAAPERNKDKGRRIVVQKNKKKSKNKKKNNQQRTEMRGWKKDRRRRKRDKLKKDEDGMTETEFIHSVICLTTGPTPLPKRFLQKLRSRASTFK